MGAWGGWGLGRLPRVSSSSERLGWVAKVGWDVAEVGDIHLAFEMTSCQAFFQASGLRKLPLQLPFSHDQYGGWGPPPRGGGGGAKGHGS